MGVTLKICKSMKRIFSFIAVSALLAGCQDNVVDDTPIVERFSAPLTLSVGESATRSFDDDLVWSWEENDKIIGYQNAGGKSRNTLLLEGGNTFYCSEFAYATEDAADFHFFYADEDAETKALTAFQDGTWRPVLVGTAPSTTLDAIEAVAMQHLSAALEVRVWQGPQASPTARTVTAATLSSESDFVGKWTAGDNLAYTQTLDGKEISLSGLDTSTVVFNMPVNEEGFASDTFTLTLTHDGAKYDYSLPALTFVAGKRTVVNIIVATVANMPKGSDFKYNYYIPDDATSVRFVVNSSVNEGDNLADSGSKYPIYLVVNGGEVEFHTPADKFMANADCKDMFAGKRSLQTINLTNVNTSKVTTMNNMFAGCESLTSLTFGNGFDTSNVTDMMYMFSKCSSLVEIDLSSFDTSKVTDMSIMFYSCESLTSLTFGDGFDTSNVTTMASMFQYCSSLTELDLSGFDTSNVTTMASMFHNCLKLEEIDLSDFDTSKVTDMADMFSNCESLTSLTFGDSFYTSNVISMTKMFNGCTSLTELDLGSFNTEKVESMAVMFSGCSSLTELDLSNFSTDFSNFSTDSVLMMQDMFAGCFSLTELNISGFNMSIQYDINVQNMFGYISAKIYVSSDTMLYFNGETVSQNLGSTDLEFVVV